MLFLGSLYHPVRRLRKAVENSCHLVIPWTTCRLAFRGNGILSRFIYRIYPVAKFVWCFYLLWSIFCFGAAQWNIKGWIFPTHLFRGSTRLVEQEIPSEQVPASLLPVLRDPEQ